MRAGASAGRNEKSPAAGCLDALDAAAAVDIHNGTHLEFLTPFRNDKSSAAGEIDPSRAEI